MSFHRPLNSDRIVLCAGQDMKGRDLIERASEIGRERGIPVRIDTERGKGSHITVYGSRFTIVKDRRKEVGPGLLSSMIRQLGLDRSDFH